MTKLSHLIFFSLILVLSGCYHNTRDSEQTALRTCQDPHTSQVTSQWQACSFNRDCTQTCGTGWSCYSSTDGYCHDH